MGSSVRPEPSWLFPYLSTPADATDTKLPRQLASQPQRTIGPAMPATAQPLHGIRRFAQLANDVVEPLLRDPLGVDAAVAGAKKGNFLPAGLALLPMVGPEARGAAALERAANPEVMQLVNQFRKASGGRTLPRVAAVDAEKAGMMAKVYESLPKNDPAAREAYDALNAEVAQQYKAMHDAGFKAEFVDSDPYKNSAEMMADVRQNRRLKVFKTPDDSFHPYMTPEQNNHFRAVHDFLAHAGEGNQFGPIGEENAYRVHASTLSTKAQQALATETRGQNSWVNYGPNAHLPVRERPFAEQKAALWPEHLLGDYHEMTPQERIAAAAIRHPDGKVTTGLTHFFALGERPYDEIPEAELAKLEEGFVTNTGRFVDRREANRIAFGRDDDEESLHTGDLGYDDAAAPNLREEGIQLGERFGGTRPDDHADLVEAFKARLGKPLRAGQTINRVQDPKTGADAYLLHDPNEGAVWDTLTPASTLREREHFLAPYIHTADPDAWKPVERGVFDRSGGAGEYREPAPLPFDVKAGPRAGVDPLAARIGEDPKVESTLLGDVLKGLNQGGRSWYGLKPVRDSYEAMDGPLSFKDFNFAGGAGSIRTPTHNELTNASILMYAKAHGITPTEAKNEFLKQFPNSMRPTFMDTGAHAKGFARAQERGVYAPVSETDAALKVPSYVHDRMLGANGIALDTHERRRIAQALGIGEDEVSAALDRNGVSYMAGTQPYHRIAMNLGLHPDQVQASRWLGGGLLTGLESQPKGDFLQTLEDGLLYTAKTRGMGTSPKDLSALWKRIAQGKDFFMPTSAKGGFPVY